MITMTQPTFCQVWMAFQIMDIEETGTALPFNA